MKKQSTIKRPSRRTIAYGTAALLAFGLLYLATFRGRAAEQQPYQVQIVAFGDSVFTDIGELVPIPDRLAALLDMDVYNAAMGGTCAARLETERRLDYTKGSMSLVGLARSVLARDFDVQLTARIPESNAERFPETVEGLSQVDFSRVETVLRLIGSMASMTIMQARPLRTPGIPMMNILTWGP